MVDRHYGNPDRHYGELTVYDCPPHRVAAVLDVIARYNLAAEIDTVGLPGTSSFVSEPRIDRTAYRSSLRGRYLS
jgi:hypothetical protein